MTTKTRDAALDDVNIPQPKPSASKLSVPVLHGLTFNQLEATRGYCETCAAVTQVHETLMAISVQTGGGPWRRPPEIIDPIRGSVRRITDALTANNSGSYEDGMRYALTMPKVAVAWQEIADVLARWKR